MRIDIDPSPPIAPQILRKIRDQILGPVLVTEEERRHRVVGIGVA